MATATKVYFDPTAATGLPSGWSVPSDSGGYGGWDTYSNCITSVLHFGTAGSSAYTNLVGVSTANETVLVAQFCGLVATGTVFTAVTDTIAMQILASYTGASPMDTPLVWMGVVSQDGVTTLADLSGGVVNLAAAGNINLTTKKNKTYITGTASYTNSYTTTGPAWLVIELGGAASAAASAINLSLRFGEGSGSGSDLPIDQTTTADGIPWLQHTSGGNTPLVAAGCHTDGSDVLRLW